MKEGLTKPDGRTGKLAFALCLTPFACMIVITAFGLGALLDGGLTALHAYSKFCAITIQAVVGFCIALLYVSYTSKRERRATLNAMWVYWNWRVTINGTNDVLRQRPEDLVRQGLDEQLSCWACGIYEPLSEGAHPSDPFELVDSLIELWTWEVAEMMAGRAL